MRQDETYRVDLAQMLHRLRGQESVMTYSRGGIANAWLRIETDGQKGGFTHLTWVDENDKPINRRFTVHMTTTAQPFGGVREWFSCPACSGNARVLYWSGGGFQCQSCAELLYMSQLEKPHDYALTRAQRIRMQLGGSANMTEPFPPKPPRMHWQTYWKLQDEHDRAANYYFACTMAWVMSLKTKYRIGRKRVTESEFKAATQNLKTVQDDPPRDWGKVSDYVTPHIAGDNRPIPKADRPACAMLTNTGHECRAKAKPGFTICARHLEKVVQAEAKRGLI